MLGIFPILQPPVLPHCSTAGHLVCPLEPLGPLQEEQVWRLQPGGQPGLPGPAPPQQVHRRGGERWRHPEKYLLLHSHLSPGGAVQVRTIQYCKVIITFVWLSGSHHYWCEVQPGLRQSTLSTSTHWFPIGDRCLKVKDKMFVGCLCTAIGYIFLRLVTGWSLTVMKVMTEHL